MQKYRYYTALLVGKLSYLLTRTMAYSKHDLELVTDASTAAGVFREAASKAEHVVPRGFQRKYPGTPDEYQFNFMQKFSRSIYDVYTAWMAFWHKDEGDGAMLAQSSQIEFDGEQKVGLVDKTEDPSYISLYGTGWFSLLWSMGKYWMFLFIIDFMANRQREEIEESEERKERKERKEREEAWYVGVAYKMIAFIFIALLCGSVIQNFLFFRPYEAFLFLLTFTISHVIGFSNSVSGMMRVGKDLLSIKVRSLAGANQEETRKFIVAVVLFVAGLLFANGVVSFILRHPSVLELFGFVFLLGHYRTSIWDGLTGRNTSNSKFAKDGEFADLPEMFQHRYSTFTDSLYALYITLEPFIVQRYVLKKLFYDDFAKEQTIVALEKAKQALDDYRKGEVVDATREQALMSTLLEAEFAALKCELGRTRICYDNASDSKARYRYGQMLAVVNGFEDKIKLTVGNIDKEKIKEYLQIEERYQILFRCYKELCDVSDFFGKASEILHGNDAPTISKIIKKTIMQVNQERGAKLPGSVLNLEPRAAEIEILWRSGISNMLRRYILMRAFLSKAKEQHAEGNSALNESLSELKAQLLLPSNFYVESVNTTITSRSKELTMQRETAASVQASGGIADMLEQSSSRAGAQEGGGSLGDSSSQLRQRHNHRVRVRGGV